MDKEIWDQTDILNVRVLEVSRFRDKSRSINIQTISLSMRSINQVTFHNVVWCYFSAEYSGNSRQQKQICNNSWTFTQLFLCITIIIVLVIEICVGIQRHSFPSHKHVHNLISCITLRHKFTKIECWRVLPVPRVSGLNNKRKGKRNPVDVRSRLAEKRRYRVIIRQSIARNHLNI